MLPLPVPVQNPLPEPSRWALFKARKVRRGAVKVAAGAIVAAAASAWWLHKPPPEAVKVGAQVVFRGVHLEGERLPAGHPLRSLLPERAMESEPLRPLEAIDQPLRVRQHCAWAKPGRNPYRGTAAQALQTATLPPEVVNRIAEDIHYRRRVDRVTIRNDKIRAHASGREFEPNHVAMTYGMTLCINTLVNFEAGHSEEADLYEAEDAEGNLYAVMVPDVCGNVSVLSERAVQGAASVKLRQLPEALRGPTEEETRHGKPGEQVGHVVTSPGTLWLTGLALALSLILRWARRKALS